MLDVISLLLFILPVYVANAAPVLLGGGKALDFDKNFIDGKPLLGKGKTIRGFIAGVLSGSLIACAFALLAPLQWFTVSCFWFWTLNTGHETQFLGGCFMALGTMIGDASGSFFKRRLGIESGKQFFPDTIVFLVFALLFAYPFVSSSLWSLENMAFLFGLTIILHPGTNFIANRLGLKKVPW